MASRPPILVVKGDEEFLRCRFVRRIIESDQEEGSRIVHVDGKKPAEVADALGGGFLMSEPTLAVVTHPEKVDLDRLTAHSKLKNPDTVLLLHVEGEPRKNSKFAKFLDTLKKVTKTFKAPAKWDQDEAAAKFCVAEAKEHKLTLDEKLASALVSRVGGDLGVLSFEIQKMALLAQAQGSSAIEAAHIRGGMAAMLEADVFPLMEALSKRTRKKVGKALCRIKNTSRGDPTIKTVRILGPQAVRWAVILDLFERGISPDDMAIQLDLNPWFFKNKVLPQVARWDRASALKLVSAFAQTERVLFSGGVNPWVVLQALLLRLCPVA